MTKTSLIFTCIIAVSTAFGQTFEIFGTVKTARKKIVLEFAPVAVLKDTTTIARTYTDLEGRYSLLVKDLGTYTIVASFISAKTSTNVITLNEPRTELNLTIEYPCEYDHTEPITCPFGLHTDKIIPIVYGLPDKKLIRQSKKGRIALGGCMGGCEKFYCKIHQKSF